MKTVELLYNEGINRLISEIEAEADEITTRVFEFENYSMEVQKSNIDVIKAEGAKLALSEG